MSTRRTPPRGLRISPSAKWLLGAMLALIGVLAPVESPDLPGPLEDVAGARSAFAQIGLVDIGTPNNCRVTPALWSPQPADPDYETAPECVLQIAPCLPTPWDSSQYLQRSAQYPELCEISVSSSDANYSACVAMTGVVVIDNGSVCRIIQNAICPSGVRISPANCRTVERRTWTCPADFIPRNEFNTCYKPATTGYIGTHPVCGAGAPTFPISSCEEYVGLDHTDPSDPNARTCVGYGLVDNPRAGTSSDYWCEFDTSLLELRCHAVGIICPQRPALCLKRASQTGGCSVIAKTIRCRVLQASYAAGTIQLENVRAALCEPCVVLPFQSIPASCPDDLTEEPTQESRSRGRNVALRAILREERDIAINDTLCYPVAGGTDGRGNRFRGGEPLADHPNCAALEPPCPDPSPGRLAWASSHSSQLAVVNSAVTIEILDIPTVYRTQRYGYTWGSAIRTSIRTVVEYPEPDPAEPENIMRLWNYPNSTITYSSVADLANSRVSGTSECFLYYLPLFKVIVRELWPDNPSDRLEIDELFGADALQWWNNIPTNEERERRTNAQGLEWWPNLSAADQAARIEEMTQDVRCDSNTNSLAWCRWQSAKPGYYKLTGAGAWVPTDAGNRQWIDSRQVPGFNNYLSGLSAADRTRLLRNLGVSTPEEAGINAAMDALLPFTNPETLFSTLSVQARCPPLDVRVKCLRARSSGNYVETESIGIMVNEVRVSTVTPSN